MNEVNEGWKTLTYPVHSSVSEELKENNADIWISIIQSFKVLLARTIFLYLQYYVFASI